jgi:sulfite reductase (ferredoxin)
MSDQPKLSHADVVKIQSGFLRGTIAQEQHDASNHYSEDNTVLLKHFGTYQQDDRDRRKEARAAGHDKYYMFMVRSKIPGGKLTSGQFLAELDLGDELANNTLRVTSRQGLQLHGVVKRDLARVIRRINEVQLSTLGACGDVNRNVMCCPAPYKNAVYSQMQELADRIAAHFAPRTSAYHELWLVDHDSGERQLAGGSAGDSASGDGYDVEPIYGKQYLPRKFKMAIGLPHDNCVDIYTNDMGFLAVVRDGRIVGYNVLVGGGLGTTPSAKKTFPALARRMAFALPEQVLAVAEAVVKVQRDFGCREDRKVARLKYLIHNWGLDAFQAKVEEYYGGPLRPCESDDVHGFDDHLGWFEQGDGRWFYGLNVENGRLYDNERVQWKSALREICRRFEPGIRLTPHQSILLTDVAPGDKDEIEAILARHHVPRSHEISTVRRWSMACVAWPTCGLSITEAERALPGIIDMLEVELARLGLDADKFTVRMTGCPNGCARPYNSDVGLVGKTLGKYTVFLGGRLLGNRLNFIYKDLVPEAEVVNELVPVFAYYKQARQNGESFGDFCHRKGKEDLLSFAGQYQAQAAG